MNCEKIKEWIITDYLDDQLDKGRKKFIDDHLAHCPGCRAFAATAKKTVIEPFDSAERLIPPPSLWLRIKETITADQAPRATGPWADFIGNLKNAFSIPKPAIAFAAVFMFILMAGAGTRLIMNHESTKEQIEYLSYLAQGQDASASGEEMGLGTSVEEYFL